MSKNSRPTKRDGRTVTFDEFKITNAIFKSISSVKKGDATMKKIKALYPRLNDELSNIA